MEVVTVSNRVTMYKVAQLCEAAAGERVREQQLYNYRKNGLIVVGSDGRVDEAFAIGFALEFAAKRAARKARNEAKVAAQLAGE